VNYADLDSFLHKDETGVEEEEKSKKDVEALHKILRSFLLRRVKSGVDKNLLLSTFVLFFFHVFWMALILEGCVLYRRKVISMSA
jgi:hypothetical protein